MAVERGHDRGRFAGNVDQDRGGRAAVLGAVIDAGEHDQGRRRAEPESERQQHGHRRHRTNPGQYADERAEKTADEAIEDVLPGQRHAQTEREVGERFHSRLTPACDAELGGCSLARPYGAYDVGQSGSGRPSSQTNTATENTIMTAASARLSTSRTSREA